MGAHARLLRTGAMMDVVLDTGDKVLHVFSTHRTDGPDETPLQMISVKRLAQLEQVEAEHQMLLRHLADLGACRSNLEGKAQG